MITKEDCLKLGIVQKPHGIEGEVILRFDQEIIEAYKYMESIFIDIDGGLVPFLFETLQETGKNSWIVKLQLVDSPEQATPLSHLDFYALRKDLPELQEHLNFPSLVGYRVFDAENNRIGIVDELITYPQNQLLRILDSSDKEILLPFADDLIHEVDEKQQQITMRLPEGLLDINKES